MSLRFHSSIRTEPALTGRSCLLESFKGLGCLLIVVHHLAFYGPMADVVAQTWPGLIGWLDQHGRLAVQVFLVCAGYLVANSLARMGPLTPSQVWSLFGQRYVRLALPLLAALSLTVLISEFLRPFFPHDSLSPPPDLAQALAHVFFVQHLWGMDGLSAGVWYAAVDLQLYFTALLVLLIAQQAPAVWPGMSASSWQGACWLLLVAASLWWWNRNPYLEDLNLYFLGAYGLGWLAYALRHGHTPLRRLWVLAPLGLVAWWLEPRWQVATAWCVAISLAYAPAAWLASPSSQAGLLRQAMAWLSRVSYSVFVVHFVVSLVVSALVTWWWPAHGAANAMGMLAAVGLSLMAGAWLYEWVEQPQANWRRWLVWAAVFMASCVLAIELNGWL